MSTRNDFENVGKLIEEGILTTKELLSKVNSGDVYLAIYADGFFVWSATKQLNNQYGVSEPSVLYENEWLYVASKYYRRFDSSEPIEMGFACSKPAPEADKLIRLERNWRSKKKPCIELGALYISRELIKRHFSVDSPTRLRRTEGIEAAKSLLREKHFQGQLRNDDDFKKWMTNSNLIKCIRKNEGRYPHCAKIRPRRKQGTTKEKEPTLTKSFVGVFKDDSIVEEFRKLTRSP